MLAAYASQQFDVAAWANDACCRKPDGEPLDRYLAELEMRLHLLAEDLDAGIEDDNARALQRIPSAVREVSHLKADASNLKGEVDRILQKLTVSADAAEQSVASLAFLDLGKSRMEEACTTLKEATELADLFQKVDSVFASGNLQKVSALLATMRRSLALVGNIAEFDGAQYKLQALEERFRSLLEPQLASAFTARNGEKVQQLSELLDGVGESSTVNKMYASSAASSMQKVWSKFETKAKDVGVSDWLPGFLEELRPVIGSEIKWTLQNLPDHYPAVVISLLQDFMQKLQPQIEQSIFQDLQQAGSQRALEHLGKLQSSYTSFLSDLRTKLSSALPEELQQLWLTIFAPVSNQISRYGDFELEQLRSELSSASELSPSDSGSQAMIEEMNRVIRKVVKILQSAAQRCIRLTQATELDTFFVIADDCFQGFVLNLKAVAQELAKSSLSNLTGNASNSTLETSSILPLLAVADSLQTQTATLDARFRGHIAELQDQLRQDFGGTEQLTAAFLRMHASDGRLEARLEALTAMLEETRFSTLTKATLAASSFAETSQQIVYDLLMHKLRTELDGVADLPVWQSQEAENKYNLPSFSAYPQPYATAAGEYLMMLPQVLEALMSATDASVSGTGGIDGDWLDKVAVGAADLYASQLSKLSHLTAHGSMQLAADLEYFCNVLHALGVAVPIILGTWQIASQWPDAEFPQALRASLQDGMLDRGTAERVAEARRLDFR